MSKLRVLLPSWRFFDRAVLQPQLYVRAVGQPWRAIAVPRRGLLGWAFAPEHNLALAYQSTVEQLVAEISELDPETPDDAPAITGTVAYELVTRIAREHAPPGAAFQWMIATPDDASFVTSPELAA